MSGVASESPARDPYWSRMGTEWQFAERRDPVRWGDVGGPLSTAELEFYIAYGYLIRPALLDADTLQPLIDEAGRLAGGQRPRDTVITEPDSDVVRSIFRVHRDSERFRALAAAPALAGTARQILGSDVYIHQSRINFKPGFDGRAFPWHSDFETWHIEDGMPRMRAVSASILLTDNTSVNGPLMLIPGSHRTYVRCVGETPPEHYKQSLKQQAYGVPDPEALRRLVDQGGIVQAIGPAGTVIFFDCNTMHGSTGNLSPYPRHNVFLVFNSIANRLTAPFGDTPPRPAFLAERDPQLPAP